MAAGVALIEKNSWGNTLALLLGVLCKCLRLVPKCHLLIVAAGIKLLVQITNTN